VRFPNLQGDGDVNRFVHLGQGQWAAFFGTIWSFKLSQYLCFA
jgi:hypothetical protein